MSFPWADWQFWTVTAAAVWGGWTLVRQLLPRREQNACGGCAAGSAAMAKKRPGSEGPPLVVLGGRRRTG